MAAKKKSLETDFDWIRRVTMNEPRGHRDMFGCVLVDAVDPTADTAAVFMDGGQFYNMCGHASLGISGMMVETGRVATTGRVTFVKIDTPAGLVEGKVSIDGYGKIEDVSLVDVPSFVFALDEVVQVEFFGEVRVDVAYGGNIFVIAEAADMGFSSIDPEYTNELIKAGIALRKAANEQLKFVHPERPHIDRIDIAMLTGEPSSDVADARNIAILGDAQVDRSPCGTGTCARMALLHARGELAVGEKFCHESSIRTVFDGRILEEVDVGGISGVKPEISCRPFLTGFSDLVVDPDDPLRTGFVLGQALR